MRNTSCFFRFLSSSISWGRNRACYTESTTYPALPCWNSLMEELEEKRAPSNTSEGFQVGTLERRSVVAPKLAPSADPFFYRDLVALGTFGGSCSIKGWISPSSELYFPIFLSLSLFFSMGSKWEVQARSGVRGLGSMVTIGEAPPTWVSRRASMLGVFFWITIPSGMLGTSWLLLIWAIT